MMKDNMMYPCGPCQCPAFHNAGSQHEQKLSILELWKAGESNPQRPKAMEQIEDLK
jgi:hypothetical protein